MIIQTIPLVDSVYNCKQFILIIKLTNPAANNKTESCSSSLAHAQVRHKKGRRSSFFPGAMAATRRACNDRSRGLSSPKTNQSKSIASIILLLS